jgi:hypothetical protein
VPTFVAIADWWWARRKGAFAHPTDFRFGDQQGSLLIDNQKNRETKLK